MHRGRERADRRDAPDRDGVGQPGAMGQQMAGGDPAGPLRRPHLPQRRDVPGDRRVQVQGTVLGQPDRNGRGRDLGHRKSPGRRG